jgi:hypothetical protein
MMDLILIGEGELSAPSGLTRSELHVFFSAGHGEPSKLLPLLLFFVNDPGALVVLIFIKQSSGLSPEFASRGFSLSFTL